MATKPANTCLHTVIVFKVESFLTEAPVHCSYVENNLDRSRIFDTLWIKYIFHLRGVKGRYQISTESWERGQYFCAGNVKLASRLLSYFVRGQGTSKHCWRRHYYITKFWLFTVRKQQSQVIDLQSANVIHQVSCHLIEDCILRKGSAEVSCLHCQRDFSVRIGLISLFWTQIPHLTDGIWDGHLHRRITTMAHKQILKTNTTTYLFTT